MKSGDQENNDPGDRPVQNNADRRIVLGSISGVFGIRGWIKVFSETEPRENIVEYKTWWIRPARQSSGRKARTEPTAAWRRIDVLEGRRQSKTVVARLDGIETPEAAQLLIGYEIAVERSQMPPLKKGEFYWTDLIGHTVLDRDGNRLGTVERMFATGANDVVVVRGDADRQSIADESGSDRSTTDNEILIPWILGSVIVDVDIEAGQIVVDWDPDY